MAKVNNLYQLFKNGEYTNQYEPNDKNYERYSYIITFAPTILISLETAHFDAFEGNEIEKNEKRTIKLQNMQRDIIHALEYHGLHSNPPSPDFVVDKSGAFTISITNSGFSKLKSMRGVTNGPKGSINTEKLKNAIAVPEKILNLMYGEKEIKTNIVKNIIENTDEHFSFVGDDTGVNSYVCVKEEYESNANLLYIAFQSCIRSLHPLRAPGDERRKFITEKITIDLYTQRFENDELAKKMEYALSDDHLKDIAIQFKQFLDSKYFTENDDYIYDACLFQLFPQCIDKLAAYKLDFRAQHLCDRSTQTTSTPTKTTLVRTVLSTTQNDILFTHLNCANNATALFDALVRYYANYKSSDKKPFMFIFSNSHKTTKHVIYLGQQGYANVYSSVNPRSTGHDAELSAARRSVAATRVKTELEGKLLSCFAKITTHAGKLAYFSENDEIVNIFKQTRDLKVLNELFCFLLENQEDIDIHSNMIGTFLFWKGNTESFKNLLGFIRDYAMTIFYERCTPMTFEQAENFRDECLELEIFNSHRSNNVLAWIFTNTDAINKIKETVSKKKPSHDEHAEYVVVDSTSDSSSGSDSESDNETEDQAIKSQKRM